jgi:hypothetical protein
VAVTVLNGTGTSGLAHRLAGELRAHGFARATPLNGRPPGAFQASAVDYASGHHADAQSVAHALGVAQVQPLEASVAALAGAATVVVIAGADKAPAGSGEATGGAAGASGTTGAAGGGEAPAGGTGATGAGATSGGEAGSAAGTGAGAAGTAP